MSKDNEIFYIKFKQNVNVLLANVLYAVVSELFCRSKLVKQVLWLAIQRIVLSVKIGKT